METSPETAFPPVPIKGPVREFIRQCCVVEGLAATPVVMVAKAYEGWAADHGADQLDRRVLQTRMCKLTGATISGTGRQALYRGITLVEPGS